MSIEKADAKRGDAKDAGKLFPLSSLIAVYVGIVLVLGMAIYGVLQYLLSESHSAGGLAVEHIGHIAFLMGPLFLTLWCVLYSKVIDPIQSFSAKLYHLASGDMTHVPVKSNIKEIADLGYFINLMIDRIQQKDSHPSSADLTASAEDLRVLAGKDGVLDSTDRDILLSSATEIEHFVSVITRNSIQFKGQFRRRKRQRES